MSWNAELAYFVTPKSGPMRAMRTLRDVNYALLDDLTPQNRYQRHWFIVGRMLLAATSSKTRLGVMRVTDALVTALEIEGWMTLQLRTRQTNIHDFSMPTARPGPDQCQAIMQAAA